MKALRSLLSLLLAVQLAIPWGLLAQPVLIQPQSAFAPTGGDAISNLRVVNQTKDGTLAILTMNYSYDGSFGPSALLLPVIEKKSQKGISGWFGADPVAITTGRGIVSVKVRYFNDEPGVPPEFTSDRVLILIVNDNGITVLNSFRILKTIHWGNPDTKPAAPEVVQAPADNARAKEEARLKVEAEARRLAEEQAKAEAQAKKLAEEQTRREEEAKQREQARLKAEAEARELAAKQKAAEAKAKAEAGEREKARLAAEAQAKKLAEEKLLAEAKAKAEAEARAEALKKAEAEAKRLADEKRAAEARARAEAEQQEKARQASIAKEREEARLKAEAETRRLAEEKRLAEAKAKAEAEEREKARLAAEAEAKKLAEERRIAEAKAKAEAEAREKEKALAKAKAQEEAKAREEARLKAEAEARALAEAQAKAKAEAEEREKAKLAAEAEAKKLAEEKRLLDEKKATEAKAIASAPATPAPKPVVMADLKTKVTNVDVVNRSMDRSQMTIGVEYDYKDNLKAPLMGVEVGRSGEANASQYFEVAPAEIKRSSRNFLLFPVKFRPPANATLATSYQTDKVLVYLKEAAGVERMGIFPATMLLMWRAPGAIANAASAPKPAKNESSIELDDFKQTDASTGYITLKYNLVSGQGKLQARLSHSSQPDSASWFEVKQERVSTGRGLQLLDFNVKRDAKPPSDTFQIDTLEIELVDAGGRVIASERKKLSSTWSRPK